MTTLVRVRVQRWEASLSAFKAVLVKMQDGLQVHVDPEHSKAATLIRQEPEFLIAKALSPQIQPSA